MMKPLVQAVCGGLRWIEVKELAEYMAKRAINSGIYLPRCNEQNNKKRRSSRKKHGKTWSENAIQLDKACIPSFIGKYHKRERLVTYDVLDCTLGGGYHSGAILQNGKPYTRIVSIDCDPEASTVARDLSHQFGSHRIRFYQSKMSEIKSMFGEKSFDAVMIDPGPSVQQLEDPIRGFLLTDENDHSFDMRYAQKFGISALSYLNSVPQKALVLALMEYKLLTPEQASKFGRIIRKCRPFKGSLDLLERIDSLEPDVVSDTWSLQSSHRKALMSWEFLTSIRCIINNEKIELLEAIQQAFLLLRENGRLVIFSRLPWEEDIIRRSIDEHPNGIFTYSEVVESSEILKYGHSRHTKMWVAHRTKNSAFVTKNRVKSFEDEEIKQSHMRWMTELYASQTHGFPANNFTFENFEPGEKNTLRRNMQPPPFDFDDETKK